MKTLELTTPRELHFKKNADTAAAALQVALDEMRDISNRYSGSNDDRAQVELWREAINQRADGLLNVNGDDALALAASIAWQKQSARFTGFMRDIQLYTPVFSTGEDGESRPLLKKIRRALESASDRVGEFSRRADTREAIARDLESVKELVGKVLLVEETMDRWQLGILTQRCDAFLRELREPLRTEPEPSPVAGPIYPKHQRLADELGELMMRLYGLNNPKLGFAEAIRPAIAKVTETQQACRAAIITNDLDAQAVCAKLQAVQAELRSLTAPPDAAPGAVAAIRESLSQANAHLVKVLAIVGAAVQAAPQPAVTVAARIGRAIAGRN